MSARPYRARARTDRASATRERIVGAVRELLAEGSFHTSTVEEVADRAGIARATLYQHFRSRLDLVDAMCETFDANPALLRLREAVAADDARAALDETLALTVRFWSTEDSILAQLYGVTAVDPAAHDLVERQRLDRRTEFGRLVQNLQSAGLLRDGVTAQRALATLLVLSSYDTYRELRATGLTDKQIAAFLQDSAQRHLLSTAISD
jgi:AcrR family transcriptional regulator